jgi:hypothetical protein
MIEFKKKLLKEVSAGEVSHFVDIIVNQLNIDVSKPYTGSERDKLWDKFLIISDSIPVPYKSCCLSSTNLECERQEKVVKRIIHEMLEKANGKETEEIKTEEGKSEKEDARENEKRR